MIFCILFLLILGCGRAYASENSDFQSRIEWDYDIEQNILTVYNAAEFFPDQPILRCIVGLYREDGQMFSCGMAVQNEEGTMEVQCTPEEFPAICTLRIFFLDGCCAPLGPVEIYNLSTTEPTCTENGYVTAEKADGSYSKVIRIIEAQGHSLDEVLLQAPADDVNCGIAERRCENCTYTEQVVVYPDCDIARLCMYGDLTGIGKKAEVPIKVNFEGAGKEIDCYALLKYQGHTSLVYDKKNYTLKLFKDEEFWKSFGTLLIFIVAGFITSFGVNLPFTYLIFRLRETRRGRFFQRAFVIPMMVPGMVGSMYWRFFYTHETGILDQVLKMIGKDEWVHLWLGEKGYAMFALLFQGFPWVGGFTMLILLAGLLNVDPALEESARMDGASSWKVFLKIYLPLLVPQIKMLSILGMIGAIQDYGRQILFTNGRYGTTVPAYEMYKNAFVKGNYGYAAAQGVVLFAIILIITILQQRLIKRADD